MSVLNALSFKRVASSCCGIVVQVAKQQEALHGSNAEAEADARRLETEIGALKSRLTSNDELHATEVASLKATNEKAAAAHAQAIKALQAQLTDVQRAAAEGEVAKLQATQLQTKVDALVRSNACRSGLVKTMAP